VLHIPHFAWLNLQKSLLLHRKGLFFNQIGHYILNRFYLIVEQMVGCEFESVAGYVENKQETRCQQGNERWQEVILSITKVTITLQ